MANKKENLPRAMETDMEQGSSITYANEVVAIIAGVAAGEVEGIAGMCSVGGIDILGRNKNITKGVKVEIGTEEASVDLYIVVEYGTPIQKAAQDAQENVRKAIETMTGLHVVRVDVHVQGVSFEKENNALEAGRKIKTALDSGKTADVPKVEAPATAQTAPAQDGENTIETNTSAQPPADTQTQAETESEAAKEEHDASEADAEAQNVAEDANSVDHAETKEDDDAPQA